jgi:hypothetical protein
MKRRIGLLGVLLVVLSAAFLNFTNYQHPNLHWRSESNAEAYWETHVQLGELLPETRVTFRLFNGPYVDCFEQTQNSSTHSFVETRAPIHRREMPEQ